MTQRTIVGWVGLVAAMVAGWGCDGGDPPPELVPGVGGGGAGGEGIGGAAPSFTCEPAWPIEGTVLRGQAPAKPAWITVCEGLSGDEVERLEVSGGERRESRTLDDQSQAVTFSLTDPYDPEDTTGPALPDVEVTFALGGVEATVTAAGPRTHLAGDELTARYAAKASASTTEVPPHLPGAAPSPGSAVTGSSLGLASADLLSTAWDEATSELVLYATAFGGEAPVELGRVAASRSEAARLDGAVSGDGGARVYATTLCTDDPACAVPMAFRQGIFNEAGQLVQLAGSGNAAALNERPLDLTIPLDRAFHQSPIQGGTGIELRTLYAGLAGATAQWTVVDAFAVDFDGFPVVEAVSNLDAIAGVTPAMVRDGAGRVGLLQSFEADLDPAVAPDETDLVAWTARPAPNGMGTTFALAALGGSEAGLALQEKTFDTLVAGTASMHVIPWGAGQARIYAGLDATGDLVAFVGEVDPNTGVVGPTRPLDIPGTYRVFDAAAGIQLRASGSGGIFALAIGFNTSEEKSETPLGSLLGGAESQTMVFDAGGSTATTESLAGIAVPRLLAEGTPSDVVVPTPAGYASAAPVDPAASALDPTMCGEQQVCSSALAESPNGFRVTYYRHENTFQDRSYFFHVGPEGTGQHLFDDDPPFTILQLDQPVVVDQGPAGSGSADVFFSVLKNDGGDEAVGLVKVSVRDGEPVGQEELTLDWGGPILRMLGGTPGGSVLLGVGSSPEVFMLAPGGSTPNQTIATGLTDGSGNFSDRACPMADPSCILVATPAPDGNWSRQAEVAGVALTREAVADLSDLGGLPVLARIAETGGGACPLQTLLYPSFGQPSEPVVLSTSSREDCADLAVPVASGPFVGHGGEAIVLATAAPDAVSSNLSLVWVEPSASGVDVVRVDLGTVDAALDLTVAGAASAIVASDVNEDRHPDVWFWPGQTRLQVAPGGGGAYFNDGRGGFLHPTATRIPGLDAMSPRGPARQPGAVQAAAAYFGFGTRNTASEAQARTPLL